MIGHWILTCFDGVLVTTFVYVMRIQIGRIKEAWRGYK